MAMLISILFLVLLLFLLLLSGYKACEDIVRYRKMILHDDYIPIYLKKKYVTYCYSEMFDNNFYDLFIDTLSKKEYLRKIEKMYIVYVNYKKLGQNTEYMSYIISCNLLNVMSYYTGRSYSIYTPIQPFLEKKIQMEEILTFADIIKWTCKMNMDKDLKKILLNDLLDKDVNENSMSKL